MSGATRENRVLLVLVASLVACVSPPPILPDEPPNILLVVADDLGYSDIGPFGSEIHTPTLDRLAKAGRVAFNFYVTPRGGPTRASLLTGVDHHLTGVGAVPRSPDASGRPDDGGHLDPRVVTVASLLRDAGYDTYMAGKWDLGHEVENRPRARGFERSFALLDDVASYWADMTVVARGRSKARYSRDGVLLGSLPDDYYSTRAFTDFLIERIDEGRGDGRPFFAYLAYQAPHSPLSLPDDWLDRCAGRYAVGFQAIQQRRLTALKRRHFVRKEVIPFPGLPTIPGWGILSDKEKRRQVRKMELYCGMVENLDHHLGRLLDHLEEIEERRNTLVVVLSDNGASATDRGPGGIDEDRRDLLQERFPHSEFENWGRPGSFVEYGAGWAQTSMVPFRLFKGTTAEGGIRSPLIVSGPGVLPSAGAIDALLRVTDITPTLLAAAGVTRPRSFRERTLEPLDGLSILSLLAGREPAVRARDAWIGFELDGDRAVRRGRWKAVQIRHPLGTGEWRLYRLDRDPAELFDRAKDEPEKLAELVALWERYARQYNVVVPAGGATAAETR